jgi:hypothetical protein
LMFDMVVLPLVSLRCVFFVGCALASPPGHAVGL